MEGETLLLIQGLACPERQPEDPAALTSSPSIQLFVSSARRIRPGFALTDGELPDVTRICHLVEGLPLAILLAASWVGVLTPAEIAAELEGENCRGLVFLRPAGRDLPAGHRSIRAVFDRSWNLLADRERQVLAGLSVFRGSFTLEAARHVTGASLRTLWVLMDRSLLQRAAGGRYMIHELLRQYAGEKLAEAPGAAQSARNRHSAYFAAAVARWWVDLQGPRHPLALAEMGAESENLRAAWDWSVERKQVAHLDQAMDGLCYFHKWLGRYEEGESLCRRTVEGLVEAGVWHREERPDPSEVVLEALGRIATFSGEGDTARHAFEESLELRQAQGDEQGSYRVLSLNLAAAAYQGQAGWEPGESPVMLAPALHEVGLAIGAGQFARAESLLAECLRTNEEPGAGGSQDLVELACVFNHMHLGHYERARGQAMACLARFRETGYRWGIERCCYLAFAALATGAYDEAQRWLQESVGLCRELRQRGHLGQALARMALVARASGDLPQARQHLCEALRVAQHVRDYETFMFQMIVVLAMAVLLADEGQDERAVELYAEALRYPLMANSQLVEDLAGRQMAAVATRLPADAVEAAEARGRAGDLEATLAGLAAELEA